MRSGKRPETGCSLSGKAYIKAYAMIPVYGLTIVVFMTLARDHKPCTTNAIHLKQLSAKTVAFIMSLLLRYYFGTFFFPGLSLQNFGKGNAGPEEGHTDKDI